MLVTVPLHAPVRSCAGCVPAVLEVVPELPPHETREKQAKNAIALRMRGEWSGGGGFMKAAFSAEMERLSLLSRLLGKAPPRDEARVLEAALRARIARPSDRATWRKARLVFDSGDAGVWSVDIERGNVG